MPARKPRRYCRCMPSDPRLARLRDLLQARSHTRAPRTPFVEEAAVALILREAPVPELLLIHRAEKKGDPWSGHMALPGGRRDPEDSDLLATALRETEEEIGIEVSRIGRIWGPLDEVTPGSRRLPPIVIAPFVVLVPGDTRAVPNPDEVQSAWWVPLAALQDADAVGEILIELEGGPRAFPTIRWRDRDIWGLTLRILTDFLQIAEEVGLGGTG